MTPRAAFIRDRSCWRSRDEVEVMDRWAQQGNEARWADEAAVRKTLADERKTTGWRRDHRG